MGQVVTPLGCTRPSSWGWVGSMMPGAEAGGGCHRGTAWLQVELRLGGGCPRGTAWLQVELSISRQFV